MKKIGLVLISLVVLLSLVVGVMGCSDDDEVEGEVVWKLATYTTEGDTITDICYNFAEKVEDLSDGRMEIVLRLPVLRWTTLFLRCPPSLAGEQTQEELHQWRPG